MPRLPRWWAHLTAYLGNYFWKECPVCGEMFSGHEWDGRCSEWREQDGMWWGEACCPKHEGLPLPSRNPIPGEYIRIDPGMYKKLKEFKKGR